MKLRLYLANPIGFSELGRLALPSLKQILMPYYEILDPFEESAVKGKRIAEIEAQLQSVDLHDGTPAGQIPAMLAELHEISMAIGKQNAALIAGCDHMLAILDGPDVDSGTAAEIGYAFAHGKRIYGYRGDLRQSRDNSGVHVNLQVEYFIAASGGRLFRSLEEMKRFFESSP